jgi:hypothetical protein
MSRRGSLAAARSRPLCFREIRMTSRSLSAALIVGTLVNGAFHHMGAGDLFGLGLALAGCALLIWFPDEINSLTLGEWTRGAQINVPTPPCLIAGFGWVVLVAAAAAINIGLIKST